MASGCRYIRVLRSSIERLSCGRPACRSNSLRARGSSKGYARAHVDHYYEGRTEKGFLIASSFDLQLDRILPDCLFMPFLTAGRSVAAAELTGNRRRLQQMMRSERASESRDGRTAKLHAITAHVPIIAPTDIDCKKAAQCCFRLQAALTITIISPVNWR